MTGVGVINPPATSARRTVLLLFSATTFTASALVFLVQPMFAKMVLPRLGGSQAVWSACVLFFQAVLLLGYLYAHLTTRYLGVRLQSVVHLLPMMAAMAFLPLALGTGEPARDGSPVLWLLRTLSVRLGLPFLAVSTMAPLVQRWFAALEGPRASDPYFLYAASNVGSIVALLAYPVLLEPFYGTYVQTRLWTLGYGVLLMLTLGCIACLRRSGKGAAQVTTDTVSSVQWRQRARWIALAFIPSSLMLGVTTHISTDLASIPLLWVVPLGAYLLTFVLAFSVRQWIGRRVIARAFPFLIAGATLAVALQRTALWFIPLHLLAFFVAAMTGHTALARSRPPADRLTEFYVWIAFGGVLGGVFNTLIAPHVFNGIFEYPIVLALACFVRESPTYRNGRLESSIGLAAIAAVPVGMSLLLWTLNLTPPSLGPIAVLSISASVAVAILAMANRRMPFNALISVTVVILVTASTRALDERAIFIDRSFFGVARVVEATDRSHRVLLHGTTIHGWQNIPAGSTCEPQSYYSAEGAMGQLFRQSGLHFSRVAVVGLGTGALACYAEPGSQWTFFDIDALIERIARDPRLFTFLQNSAGGINVRINDGRKGLQDAAPGTYDLIVLDAFSSDAVPVHLITREALRLYFGKLAAGGAVVIHITNRYLNLEPMLADLTSREAWFALTYQDERIPVAEAARGRLPSRWVLISTQPQRWSGLRDGGWRALRRSRWVPQWTDDYSNLLSTVRLSR